MSVASSILKINVYLCTFKNKSSPNVLRLQIKVKFGCESYWFPFILTVFPEHATELMSRICSSEEGLDEGYVLPKFVQYPQ